jgi:predicted nucleic acid-binding Zn ribbon protein
MSDEKPLKDLLNSFLKVNKLSNGVDEISVANSWNEIVGKSIASRTQKVTIRKNTMYLKIDSAPLKNELNYHKDIIIQKVNNHLGKNLIHEIIIS